MKNVAIFEAKARFSELLAAVQSGEEVSITKHGKPVVRMVAVPPDDASNQARQEEVQAAFRRLAELREGFVLEGDVKEIIAEGRR
jgi:prevent-host-death family protein